MDTNTNTNTKSNSQKRSLIRDFLDELLEREQRTFRKRVADEFLDQLEKIELIKPDNGENTEGGNLAEHGLNTLISRTLGDTMRSTNLNIDRFRNHFDEMDYQLDEDDELKDDNAWNPWTLNFDRKKADFEYDACVVNKDGDDEDSAKKNDGDEGEDVCVQELMFNGKTQQASVDAEPEGGQCLFEANDNELGNLCGVVSFGRPYIGVQDTDKNGNRVWIMNDKGERLVRDPSNIQNLQEQYTLKMGSYEMNDDVEIISAKDIMRLRNEQTGRTA